MQNHDKQQKTALTKGDNGDRESLSDSLNRSALFQRQKERIENLASDTTSPRTKTKAASAQKTKPALPTRRPPILPTSEQLNQLDKEKFMHWVIAKITDDLQRRAKKPKSKTLPFYFGAGSYTHSFGPGSCKCFGATIPPEKTRKALPQDLFPPEIWISNGQISKEDIPLLMSHLRQIAPNFAPLQKTDIEKMFFSPLMDLTEEEVKLFLDVFWPTPNRATPAKGENVLASSA